LSTVSRGALPSGCDPVVGADVAELHQIARPITTSKTAAPAIMGSHFDELGGAVLLFLGGVFLFIYFSSLRRGKSRAFTL
jgi:hypothetical protein